MRALVARLAAAVVLTAAVGLVVPAAPAVAAACPDADGVTVVVDYHELGGGLQQVCDTGGAGKDAAQQLTESGFTLTRVQQQPGFVCRVDGLPTQDDESCVRTPPADAYWGLWWSDGTSGTWTYATEGVDSLEVPEGGYVALSWNGSSTKSPPGATPRAHRSSSPSPTPHPTSHPTTSGGGPGPGTGGSSSPAGGATDAGSPSTSPSTAPSASGSTAPGDQKTKQKPGKRPGKADAADKKKHSRGPSDEASPSPEDSASPSPASATSDPPGTDAGGLPSWVAPAAIGLLFAAAAGTAVVRRRRGASGS